MVLDPRPVDEITADLESSLKGRIDKLTNFVETSFNGLFIRLFGDEYHELEVKVLAAQLSGFVEFAGRDDLDETDLDRLGIDDLDPDELNEYMESEQLDRLAPIVGLERDPGSPATGEVTVFTATDDTRVPEGMEVATQPDTDGNNLVYQVDADGDGEIGDAGFVTPSSGTTEVTVDVIATDVGDEFNVGSGSITFLPSPPPGIEGVTNTSEVTGGDDQQSDASFRNDIQNAVFNTSGGGTARGIEGKVEDDVLGVTDVAIDEFPDRSPPTVDVIVDGGSDSDVIDAINEARPVGIEHDLVRPENINTGLRVETIGSNVDTLFLEDRLEDFLTDLSIGEELRRSLLVQRILNIDDNIQDLGSLTVALESVVGESELYESGTDIYELDFTPLGEVDREERLFRENVSTYQLVYDDVVASSVGIRATVGDDEVDLVRGTDYEVIDDNGDGKLDTIDFSIGGDNPEIQSTFAVAYEHNSASVTDTITDESGTTFDKGVDYDVIDNDGDGRRDSIDWSIGGSSPAAGDLFFVDYDTKRTISRDQRTSKREKISAGNRLSVSNFTSNE